MLEVCTFFLKHTSDWFFPYICANQLQLHLEVGHQSGAEDPQQQKAGCFAKA